MSAIQVAEGEEWHAPGTRILIVEDDSNLAGTLRLHLERQNYDVRWAADGSSGLEMAITEDPDLVLLDVGLPRMNGREVCRRLRAESDVPVIFMTAARSEEDIVNGLYQGADGYVCKPFGLAELSVRIKAALRRRAERSRCARRSIYDDGTLYADTERGIVRKGGRDVPLAPKERQLLCYLIEHAGEVVSRRELLQSVWGAEYLDARNYVTLYIRYLRRKIEDDPDRPYYLRTRHGIGYSFRSQARQGALPGNPEP